MKYRVAMAVIGAYVPEHVLESLRTLETAEHEARIANQAVRGLEKCIIENANLVSTEKARHRERQKEEQIVLRDANGEYTVS